MAGTAAAAPAQPSALAAQVMDAPAEHLANASAEEMLHTFGLLDTPAEQRFDDLTALARSMCGGDAAFISLVDRRRRRLFFKSAQLLGAAAQERLVGSELPLPDGLPSFCERTTATCAPLTVQLARW
jgi:hypothetical protein